MHIMGAENMNKLKEIREAFGMTQDELARMMGISKQAINGWEKGSRKIPEARKKELAKIFDLDGFIFDEYGKDSEAIEISLEGIANYEKARSRVEVYLDAIYGKNISKNLKEVRAEQKELEKKIHNHFDDRKIVSVMEQLKYTSRAVDLYKWFSDIVDLLYAQNEYERSIYTRTILEILMAMTLAIERNYDFDYEKMKDKYKVDLNRTEELKELIDKNIISGKEEQKLLINSLSDNLSKAIKKWRADNDLPEDSDPIDIIRDMLAQQGIYQKEDDFGEE